MPQYTRTRQNDETHHNSVRLVYPSHAEQTTHITISVTTQPAENSHGNRSSHHRRPSDPHSQTASVSRSEQRRIQNWLTETERANTAPVETYPHGTSDNERLSRRVDVPRNRHAPDNPQSSHPTTRRRHTEHSFVPTHSSYYPQSPYLGNHQGPFYTSTTPLYFTPTTAPLAQHPVPMMYTPSPNPRAPHFFSPHENQHTFPSNRREEDREEATIVIEEPDSEPETDNPPLPLEWPQDNGSHYASSSDSESEPTFVDYQPYGTDYAQSYDTRELPSRARGPSWYNWEFSNTDDSNRNNFSRRHNRNRR